MTSTQVGGISVSVVANIAKFQKSIGLATRTMSSFAKGVGGAVFSVKGLVAALTGGALVATFTKFTANAFAQIDALGELSDKTGVATEKLVGLQLAAAEAGISNELLEKSLVRLNVKMGMQGDVALRKWIEETVKLGTQQEKLAAAVEMFGSKGSDMVRFLNGGVAALDASQAAAELLGKTLDRKTVAGVERAIDAFGRLKSAVEGVFFNVAAAMAPELEVMAIGATNLMTKGVGGVKGIGQAIGKAVIEGIKRMGDLIQSMVGGVLNMVADFKALVHTFRSTAPGWLGVGFGSEGEKQASSKKFNAARDIALAFANQPKWSAQVDEQKAAIAKLIAGRGSTMLMAPVLAGMAGAKALRTKFGGPAPPPMPDPRKDFEGWKHWTRTAQGNNKTGEKSLSVQEKMLDALGKIKDKIGGPLQPANL